MSAIAFPSRTVVEVGGERPYAITIGPGRPERAT